MDNENKFIVYMLGTISIPVILVLFLLLIICSSSKGNINSALNSFFITPLESSASFRISSGFGYRVNPLKPDEVKLHTGIDLATSSGTNVLSAGDGYVVEVGFQENGFGNYVYIEHHILGLTLYTAYGHMLDDSIVVSEGQPVKKGDKIGQVGATGAVTGEHLHFTIMINKLSFTEDCLIDPMFVVGELEDMDIDDDLNDNNANIDLDWEDKEADDFDEIFLEENEEE